MIGRGLLAAAAIAFTTVAQGQGAGRMLPAGVYEGSYICPQGPTGLRLTLRSSGRGRQTARFDFGGHDGVPQGAYLVTVQAEGEDIVLTPLRWLTRPSGYDMVGARLRHERGQLSGTISNPDCGEVSLHRVGEGEARSGPEAE